jgi:biotin operon repressor
MTADARRTAIREALASSTKPVSAAALAPRVSVSRQIIVGDIALLRAAGAEIDATPRGYVMARGGEGVRRTIACLHTAEQRGRSSMPLGQRLRGPWTSLWTPHLWAAHRPLRSTASTSGPVPFPARRRRAALSALTAASFSTRAVPRRGGLPAGLRGPAGGGDPFDGKPLTNPGNCLKMLYKCQDTCKASLFYRKSGSALLRRRRNHERVSETEKH